MCILHQEGLHWGLPCQYLIARHVTLPRDKHASGQSEAVQGAPEISLSACTRHGLGPGC